MPVLQANVAANAAEAAASGCSLGAQPLVWGTEAVPTTESAPIDLVVAANVCYDEALVAPLAHTITSLLARHTRAVALLALSDLRHFGYDAPDYDCLLGALRKSGMQISRVVSLDPSTACDRLAGLDVQVADSNREHMIDVFTIRTASTQD